MRREQTWEEFRREQILVTLVFNLWLCIFLIF
jgi:hypothetical protein